MRTMEFKFEIVTPMFIGGASPNGEAELRAPSIKGMLRWWFRALGGSRDEEERIFGSTQRRSRIKIRVEADGVEVVKPKQETFNGELAYLGYGSIGWDNETRSMRNIRPFIKPEESNFKIYLHIGNQSDIEKILYSFWAWVHLGGLGSRSRRGWGSVRIVEYPKEIGFMKWDFNTHDEFKQFLRNFFKQVGSEFESLPDTLTDYSRISKNTRIFIGNTQHDSYENALKEIGEKMISFRNMRYYHDVKRLMEEAEQPKSLGNFLDSTGINEEYGSPVPKAIFGLPNNYMSKTRRKKRYPWQVSVEAILGRDDITRRASQLLIKIMKWNNGKFSWVLTYIPSKFLPEGASLKLTFPPKGAGYLAGELKNKIVKANPPSHGLLEEFLKELSSISLEVSL